MNPLSLSITVSTENNEPLTHILTRYVVKCSCGDEMLAETPGGVRLAIQTHTDECPLLSKEDV